MGESNRWNNYAISTADLAKSLTKSSGSLVAANGTLEEAVALTATANTIIQDADVVGTALKTVAMRLRGTSVEELQEEGLDTDGAVTSKSKLRGQIQGLAGIDILTDTGAYKSTYQILSEIADVWKDIDNMDQAALLELLAGKRAGSVMAAILQNPQTLKDAFESAQEAQGSALAENEKYLDSIQGRIDLFNNSVQTMWSNTLDDDIVKDFVNLGTEIVKIIDDIGLVQLALTGLAMFGATKYMAIDWSAPFKNIFNQNTVTSIELMQSKLADLQTTYNNTRNAWKENPTATSFAAVGEAKKNLDAYKVALEEQINTENALQKARENLANAQARLDGYTGKSAKELYKYQDGVTRAKQKVEELEQSQRDMGSSGSSAFQKLGDGASKLSAQIKSIVTQMLVMWAINQLINGIQKIISGGEDATESFEDLSAELSNTKSELRDLESQLKTVNGQIEEINSNTPLTFSDQEELSRLQAESTELQRQIDLTNTLRKQQQQGVNASAVATAERYKQTGVKTGKTTGENVGSKATTGAGVGAGIGVASGVGTAILGTDVGAKLGAWAGPVGMLIGGGIGALVGLGVGALWGAAESASEETVGESLDNLQAQYSKLRKEYETAQGNYLSESNEDNRKKLEEAQKALNDYEAATAQYLSEMDAIYSQMDWETATTDQRQAMQDFYDMQDKWAIQSGGANAKTNAITRILGERDDFQDIGEKLKELANDGEEINWAEIFNDEGRLDTFKSRLYGMGLTLTEVEYYFRDAKEAEEELEESELWGTIKQIANLEDGVHSLANAFDELTKKGVTSAKTLASLYDQLNIADTPELIEPWKRYIDIMSSGTASTEEARAATEEFMESYIDANWSSAATDLKSYSSLVANLQSMGFTNAKEYVDAFMQKKVADEIASSVFNADGKFNTNYEHIIELIKQKYEGVVEIDDELIDKAIEVAQARYTATLTQKKKDQYDSAVNGKERAEKQAKEEAQLAKDAIMQKPLEESGITTKYEIERYERRTVEGSGDYQITVPIYGTRYEYKGVTYGTLDEVIAAALTDVDMAAAQASSIELPTEVTAEDTTTANNNLDAVESEYQAMLDDRGLEFEMSLPTPDEAVDQIQSIYDTLAGAVKEYNESGYLTVDTTQELLSLEPKYLDLLVDENGNLNLSKEALYNVAIARLTDMKLKQQDAILTDAENLARTGSVDALNEQVTAMYGEADAYDVLIEKRLHSIRTVLAERQAKGELSPEFGINGYIDGLRGQLDAVEHVSNLAIDNIANSLSSAGNTAASEVESALDLLLKRYERGISNLENQQTYLQNEIDLLEAEHKGVSKGYYEEQIAIEQKKLSLYEQQRSELLALLNSTAKGTDEWYDIADAIWEVEHAIQESTVSMVEFRQSIIDLYKTAFDDLANAYGNQDDLFSDRQSYIEKYMELLELQGEVTPASGYQDLIAEEENKMSANINQLNDLRAALQAGMDSGYIKEGSDEWVEMQSKIRETEAAILDNKIALEQYNDELRNLNVEAFNLVRDAFANQDTYFTNQQDYIEGYISYLEALGINTPDAIYEKLIEIEKDKRGNNVEDLIDAREGFAKIEAAGYTAADEEWQEAYTRLVELEKAVQDNDIAIAEYQKTLREMDFERFDQFIERLQDITSELENVYNIVSKEDVAFEDGTWTKEGITSLGLMHQQMEQALQTSQAYGKEIEELTAAYERGEMSEKDYYARLQELQQGQWGAIDSYEAAKDAIVDLEEARISLVEEGLNEEIEAYQELIDLKKEELDAERNLHDFRKNIQKQTKDIAQLERRIASLSGSSATADVAERRKLEAELREAKDSLNDTYYSHSKDSQGKALDDEMDMYRTTREDYVEELRDRLDDVDTIIEETLQQVLANADTVLSELNTISSEYGVGLSSSLTTPWTFASSVATRFKEQIETDLSSLVNEDGVITFFNTEASAKLAGVFGTGSSTAWAFQSATTLVMNGVKSVVENASSPMTANLRLPWDTLTAKDGPISTFSTQAKGAIDGALTSAKNNATSMTSSLTSPWKSATTSVNTFSKTVASVLGQALTDAKMVGQQIGAALNITSPSYDSGTVVGAGAGTAAGAAGAGNPASSKDISALQTVLNGVFQAGITVDGIMGEQTTGAIKLAQFYLTRDGFLNVDKYSPGVYDKLTAQALGKYIDYLAKSYLSMGGSSMYGQGVRQLKAWKSILPAPFYAKGTLGTKKNEWAITDELGDELTMYATPEGRLSYMRVGSTVVPHDLTKELIDIGEVGLEGLTNMPKFNSGVNLMSNYISKPEVNLTFDALVKAERIDEGTLPEVKKFVTQELDKFTRQLNYSLKKIKG